MTDDVLHWTTESVFSERLADIGGDEVSVSVNAEVPIGATGPLPREGRRYFMTYVDVELGDTRLMFDVADARTLADLLRRAADEAERIDAADTAPCGHWKQCGCECEKHEPVTPDAEINP